MDTISRENNSMLPIGGIIVGVIGLLIGGFAAIKVSGLQKTVADNQTQATSRIDAVEQGAAATTQQVTNLRKEQAQAVEATNAGFKFFSEKLDAVSATVVRLDEEMKKKPVATAKSSGPVVAGPGEYVVKSGDSFSKIGRAHGVSAADIAAVNPGVDSSKLKVNQKLKLPSTAKK